MHEPAAKKLSAPDPSKACLEKYACRSVTNDEDEDDVPTSASANTSNNMPEKVCENRHLRPTHASEGAIHKPNDDE
jgi:hypothetical protein